MNQRMVTLVATFLFGALATQCHAQRPVARVLHVEGEAEVHSQASKPRPLAVYGSLYAGDRIHLQPKASVVVGFRRTGELRRVVADKQEHAVTITKTNVEPGKNVTTVAAKKVPSRVVAKSITELPELKPNGATVTRGPPRDPPYPTIVPISDSAVLEGAPVFTWPASKGAATYTISVHHGPDQLWTTQTKKTSLTYAANRPLEQGGAYRWRVVAKTAEGSVEVCHASFRVAYADEAEGLAELAASEEPALLALAAAAYEQAGLLSQAISTYERLVEATPESAPAHAALSDLYQRAGQSEQAAESRQKAIDLGFEFEQPEGDADSDPLQRE